MKKFCAFLLIAMLTVMGVSAKGELSNAVKLNVTPQAVTTAKAVKTPVKKLSRALKHQSSKALNPQKALKKVPAKAVNLDEWTSIGKAQYSDDIIYGIWGFSKSTLIGPYAVDAYQNKADANKYLLLNVYPQSVLDEYAEEYYTEYTLVDGEQTNVILTVDPATKQVTADYNATLNDPDNGDMTITAEKPGTYDGSTITFPDEAFTVTFTEDDPRWPHDPSKEFTIVMPVEIGAGGTTPDDPNTGIDLTQWEAIGESEYSDGIFFAANGFADDDRYVLPTVKVATYRNKENGNKFLLADIYPESVLDRAKGLNGNQFQFADGKKSNLTLTVNPTTLAVAAEYDMTLEEIEDGLIILSQKKDGVYNDGTVTFAPGDFSIKFMGSNKNSGQITIALPEGTELVGGTTPDDPVDPGTGDLDLEKDWNLLGDGQYQDGALTSLFEESANPYTVAVYQSKTDENKYLFYDIFPAEYLDQFGGYVSSVEGKASYAIYTVNASNQVSAEYVSNVAYYGMYLIEIKQDANGSFIKDNFVFDAGALIASYYGYSFACNKTIASLPGAGDPDAIDLSDWNELGTGKYIDGFLYAGGEAYDVPVYQSKSNPNKYLFYNIYPADYLADGMAYEQIDNKASYVVYTVGTDNSVTAEYVLNVYEPDEEESNIHVVQFEPGTFLGGNFKFEAEAFGVYLTDTYAYYSLAFTASLPGAKDYAFNVVSGSNLVSADNKMIFGVYTGSDVTTVKLGLDIYSIPSVKDDEDLAAIIAEGQDIEPNQPGYVYNFDFAGEQYEEGYYNFTFIGLNADNEIVGLTELFFYKQDAFVEDEWVSLGEVDFTDDTVGALYSAFEDDKTPTYKVQLMENKANPSKFCLINPYANSPYAEYYKNNEGLNYYLKFTMLTANYGNIALQPTGLSFGYPDNWSIRSSGMGMLKDGHYNFPSSANIVIYDAKMESYPANKSRKFDIEVPNLLKVTVTAGQKPVEGAVVMYDDFSEEGVTTDAQGVAYFPYPYGNDKKIVAYKDGYEMFEIPAAETRYAEVTAELVAAKATLTVIVSDEEGEPIADAWVYVLDKEVQTGENGQAVISDLDAPAVIGTEVDFRVYKDGYDPFEGKADFTETMDAYAMATLKPAVAKLTVIVTDEEGEPVADAWVTFQGQEVQTGENGQVVIENINALEVLGKSISFTVYKDGYEPADAEADFTETIEAYSIVTLKAAVATLNVSAIDVKNETPIAGATVTVLDKEYTTDENGKAVIELNALDVLGKKVEVSVKHDHYATFVGEADFTEGIEAWVFAEMTESSSSIDTILRDVENGTIVVFDLNGRRVRRPAAGNVYIINGMKVLVK
ncbi:MAG: Ig-like domain-containing protein [Duncaniella sp.]|nr:Ig-like domain-containing protein [Duncaniella sp.]